MRDPVKGHSGPGWRSSFIRQYAPRLPGYFHSTDARRSRRVDPLPFIGIRQPSGGKTSRVQLASERLRFSVDRDFPPPVILAALFVFEEALHRRSFPSCFFSWFLIVVKGS